VGTRQGAMHFESQAANMQMGSKFIDQFSAMGKWQKYL
jgi:hypothetical protein